MRSASECFMCCLTRAQVVEHKGVGLIIFCVKGCRVPDACEKNHVRYMRNSDKKYCELVLAHFKNDTIKGTQHLPMDKHFKHLFCYLEQAHSYLGPECPTLWFNSYGETYEQCYWSQICSKALTLPDGRRITAKDYRHLFATSWRDFINLPSTTMAGLTLHELDAAAADLMCTSTYAFTNAYDDTNRARGITVVMEKWIPFLQFVANDFRLKSSEQ